MEMKPNTKIRVRLESFNAELLVSSCQKIIDTLGNTSLNSIGMITLPTAKRIYCVLRSPHVDKDSREHFEVRLSKRFIDLKTDSPAVLNLLLKTELPSGVACSLKVLESV